MAKHPPTYKYKPLMGTEKSIRLLRIIAAAEGEVSKVKLQEFCFSALPEYHCLSC